MTLNYEWICPGCATRLELRNRVVQSRRTCPQCGILVTVEEIDRQAEARRVLAVESADQYLRRSKDEALQHEVDRLWQESQAKTQIRPAPAPKPRKKSGDRGLILAAVACGLLIAVFGSLSLYLFVGGRNKSVVKTTKSDESVAVAQNRPTPEVSGLPDRGPDAAPETPVAAPEVTRPIPKEPVPTKPVATVPKRAERMDPDPKKPDPAPVVGKQDPFQPNSPPVRVPAEIPKGFLRLKSSMPIAPGVEAWVEVDDKRVADFQVGFREVGLDLTPGSHRITVKATRQGKTRVIHEGSVEVVSGITEIVTFEGDTKPQPPTVAVTPKTNPPATAKVAPPSGTLVLKLNALPNLRASLPWVEIDGKKEAEWPLSTSQIMCLVPTGSRKVTVYVFEGKESRILLDTTVEVVAGKKLLIEIDAKK